jgi:hypothetical protein
MNITVNVVITPSPELIALIQGIFGGNTTPGKKSPVKAVTEKPADTPAPGSQPSSDVKPDTPVVSMTSSPSVTIEEVRAAAKAKMDAGKKEQVKNLLTSFNTANITKLAPEHFADFLQKVNAL